MKHGLVLRWPALAINVNVRRDFQEYVKHSLQNYELERIVSREQDTTLYIKPQGGAGDFTDMINLWHHLYYNTYRNNNFDPFDEVTISWMYDGVIYRGMFPVDSAPCEYGFFKFKITGTFII